MFSPGTISADIGQLGRERCALRIVCRRDSEVLCSVPRRAQRGVVGVLCLKQRVLSGVVSHGATDPSAVVWWAYPTAGSSRLR